MDSLLAKMDESWIGNKKVLREQLDIMVQVLQTGAYAIPSIVLDSEVVDLYLKDAITKDYHRCLDEIRKGKLLQHFYRALTEL